MQNRWIAIGTIILALIVASGCTSPAPGSGTLVTTPAPGSQETVSQSPSGASGFSLHVANLNSGDALPAEYTCEGTSESPQVSWENIPPGTKSLVLVLEDPDAHPTFTHWLVFNIPPESRMITRDQPNAKVLADGSQQGDSSAGSRGYYPPCPPPGPSHRYIFRLFAVDMDITQPTADRSSIDWALIDHTLGDAKFVTTFKR